MPDLSRTAPLLQPWLLVSTEQSPLIISGASVTVPKGHLEAQIAKGICDHLVGKREREATCEQITAYSSLRGICKRPYGLLQGKAPALNSDHDYIVPPG